MRQLCLYLADPNGFRTVLEVRRGRRHAHLLYVPTLEHVRIPLAELARQERCGLAREVPIARGLIGRIEEQRRRARRYRFRFSELFVAEALAAARAERAGDREAA